MYCNNSTNKIYCKVAAINKNNIVPRSEHAHNNQPLGWCARYAWLVENGGAGLISKNQNTIHKYQRIQTCNNHITLSCQKSKSSVTSNVHENNKMNLHKVF